MLGALHTGPLPFCVLNGVKSRELPYVFVNPRGKAYVKRGRLLRLQEHNPTKRNGGAAMLWRLIKVVLVLVALGFIGLSGYAYLGDLSPVQSDVTQPVTLDAAD